MKLIVVGRTDATISLNKTGVYIHGRERAVLNIENEEQQNEINGLINAGFIEEIIEKVDPPLVFIQPTLSTTNPTHPAAIPAKTVEAEEKQELPKKRGRPKKETPKELTKEAKDQIKVNRAEANTQKMGSRVIISTGDGQPVETRMRHSAINDIVESEKTAASMRAMEKLEKEEKEEAKKVALEESSLNPSDQMGRKAVISTESGEEKVNLVNSVLPESNKIKEADPFIDRDSDDDFDDAFIKI